MGKAATKGNAGSAGEPPGAVELACRLQTELDSMSSSDRKIANYLLRHPQRIANAAITSLAAKIGTSPSTITRFCQSLGYAGFSQFKFNFENSAVSSMLAKQELAEGDSIQAIKQKLSALYMRGIEETLQRMDAATLERISERFVASEKVFFFGQFSNGIVANMAEALFIQLGIPAFSYDDHPTAAMAAALLGPKDTAVGISSSGYAKTPVDALRIAQKRGAATVGITGMANSLMSKYSDLLLCFNIGVEDIRLVHIERICAIIILGVLQNCIARKNYSLVTRSLGQSRETLLSGRYAKNEKLDREDGTSR